MLLMMPWLTVGGVEKFSCDLVEQLLERDHQVTLCTTLASDDPWLPRFTRLTPDIFSLPAFLRPPDFPRFLLYLIDSRRIDVILVSNTYLGYQLLPFLRSRRPDVTFVDYVHMEAEHWRKGGFGRVSVAYQELLDLTVVSTDHLRRWMVEHSGEVDRIEVCHTNVDTGLWDPARSLWMTFGVGWVSRMALLWCSTRRGSALRSDPGSSRMCPATRANGKARVRLRGGRRWRGSSRAPEACQGVRTRGAGEIRRNGDSRADAGAPGSRRHFLPALEV